MSQEFGSLNNTYPGYEGPLYMKTTHVGLVLELREMNGGCLELHPRMIVP